MIDCNDCPHLSITEGQQERLWRDSNKKAMLPHICTKYNQRVLHYPYREPMIHPCRQCEEEKGELIMKETNDALTFPLTDYIRDLQHDQSILNTPYIGDPPPGILPQVGDWPPAPTPCDPPSYPDIYLPDKNSKVGWICPKCGRCLAPHVDSCPCCNNYPRGLRANTRILDEAMDADLKDIIYGNGLKNADTYKADGPGIYKEK